MTPAARLQAAIEVLDRIASSRQPADQALKAWGAASRYAGSNDRRAVADRVYQALRGGGGEGGRRAVLSSLTLDDALAQDEIAALFSGQAHAPAALTAEEAAWLGALSRRADPPDFIRAELERGFAGDWREEAEALLRSRAPLDIRIKGLGSNFQVVSQALAEAEVTFASTPFSALGLRIEGAPDLQSLDVFKAGAFEVQDEGSQIAALLADPHPGDTVVDYCAGGGGKTLALWSLMQGRGRLVACDLNPRRLDAVRPRLERASAVAELRRVGPTGDPLTDLQAAVDRVLVDAPCSGSGTWRRRPEEAWRLTPKALQDLAVTQAEVLAKASALVKPGGRLVYVTCSVLPSENADIVAAFADAHPGLEPLPIDRAAANLPGLTDAGRARLAELSAGGHTVQLSPRRTGTDGFFIALFERTS